MPPPRAPAATHRRPARVGPRGNRSASAHASSASARNAPATGLASVLSRVRPTAAAATRRRSRAARLASSAPMPIASPRSKGTRFARRLTAAPHASQIDAILAARAVEKAVEERREQGGDERHRDGRHELRADQRAEGRSQQRVREQMVPAVPRVVPERETDPAEQVAAIRRRRQIGARWREDHIDEARRRRDRPRRRSAHAGAHSGPERGALVHSGRI